MNTNTNSESESDAKAACEALDLAGISAGFARQQEGLSEALRRLHRSILLKWVEIGKPPGADRLRVEAARLDVHMDTALQALASRDLIVRDPTTGEITGAYPFSGVPSPHRVEIERGEPVYAMCAIDALGIPLMLGRNATIESRDMTDGQPVRIEISDTDVMWVPKEAVVFIGSRGDAASIAHRCCSVTNFFRSAGSADVFQRANPSIGGRVLTQTAAVQAAQKLFGKLVKQ